MPANGGSGGRPGTSRELLRDKGIVRLLWCSVLGFGGFAMLLSALPVWAVSVGIPPGLAGLTTTTATLAVTVATQFAVPALVARFGIGPSLAAGLVALGAPAPLYAVATTPAAITAVSAVRGIGFGLLTVIGSLLVAMLAPRGAHGRAAGLYGASVGFPTLVAVPGGVWLGQQISFPVVLTLAAAPVLAVPAALAYRHLGKGTAGTGARSFRMPAARSAAAPTSVLVVVTLAGGGLYTFVPIGLPRSATLAPVALLVLGAAAAVSRLAVGGMADRRGASGLLVPAVVLTAVGTVCAGAGLAVVDDETTVPAVALLLLGALLAGAGYGAVQNLTLVLAFARSGPDGSATASTVWNAGYDTGTAAGAGLVGLVAGAGLGLPVAVGLTALPVLAVLPVVLRMHASRAGPVTAG